MPSMTHPTRQTPGCPPETLGSKPESGEAESVFAVRMERSRYSSRPGERHVNHGCGAAQQVSAVTSLAVNHVKNRMQALGLLDRSIKAATNEELAAAIEALDDDHREGLESFVEGELDVDSVRAAVKTGRIDGTMEAIAAIISDAALATCIEQLGENADNPSTDQLKEVLPPIVEKHSLAVARIMLAATVAGEAPASAIIRDLLKNDDVMALPKVPESEAATVLDTSKRPADEQDKLRAERKAAKAAKKDANRARKAQSASAKPRK